MTVDFPRTFTVADVLVVGTQVIASRTDRRQVAGFEIALAPSPKGSPTIFYATNGQVYDRALEFEESGARVRAEWHRGRGADGRSRQVLDRLEAQR